MIATRMSTLAALIALCGCTTQAERRAAERAAVEKKAAQELRRICALPGPERDAAIKKAKDASGIVIYCGNE